MAGGAQKQYTDEEMLQALRQASSATEDALTVALYDGYQIVHGGPVSQTIIKRFSSWSAACQAASIAANPARTHATRWTREDLIGWVARYLQSQGATGTYNGYLEWAKTVEGAPSGPRLYQTFPKWGPLKELAEALSVQSPSANDPSQSFEGDFTVDDLCEAVSAVTGPWYLREWGAVVVSAVEQVIASRVHGRVEESLFRLLKETAEFANRGISPFDRMLEGPQSLVVVYQAHREALNELAEHRDAVLGPLTLDVASRVLAQMPGLSWAQLEGYGAVRTRPHMPDDWDLP